ncbi:DUF4150 domain-containing protein [Chitinimonas viridis]|uniref:DUF4150 domain-containing protein n=2 Tax=Chitinimonas TaxID=240411 RepID=A0ABT8B9T9_9NEIS|nr:MULTISPECIES: DUF4150 domain-containing protein [Chitinimonas]MDN3579009.1 DUF4150 domain-containing protein [Chitinimonas viridis]GLR12861.1 type VI secretion protein [Chitinimonas prasina]
MFANTNLGVMNLGFPDVCLTPPLAVPVPYPNITFSVTHIPSIFNFLIGGGLAENLLTQGTVSLGDFTGVLLGVASGTMAGPDRPVLGSFKVMHGPVFATRMTTLNIQNSTNTIGVSLTPAQVRVLLLS